MNRRDFAISIAAALGTLHALRSSGADASGDRAPNDAGHDMTSLPEHWRGNEKIAFLIYPEFTALDTVGPQYMLANLMGAKTFIVAKTMEPVKSDTGLVFTPSTTFDECPRDLDLICVPGGTLGTLAAMNDDPTLRFLKHVGGKAKYITSVCTGSLVLGAAGLLDGYKATSHWVTRDLLSIFGATPTDGRVVSDRNRITGGGVTAGIDFGLSLVGSMRDATYAQGVQLLAEYAPDPPFDAGTPQRAPAEVKAMIDAMFVDFVKQAEDAGRMAFAKSQTL